VGAFRAGLALLFASAFACAGTDDGSPDGTSLVAGRIAFEIGFLQLSGRADRECDYVGRIHLRGP
jgi:hypothetical protein